MTAKSTQQTNDLIGWVRKTRASILHGSVWTKIFGHAVEISSDACWCHNLCVIFSQPKRQKKEKKETVAEKKPETMEVSIAEKSPVSPTGDDMAGEGKDDDKPRGTYALADMDKATFDEVRA